MALADCRNLLDRRDLILASLGDRVVSAIIATWHQPGKEIEPMPVHVR